MNIFKIFGMLALDGKEQFDRDVDEATSKGSKLAGAISTGLKTAAKVGTAAISVAATGIAALTKTSVGQYAEYEQLVGGVETLFKESKDAVMEYAESAYKTAGLSANEYMETVTSFSASLLQGLNGDTAKAAAIADQAIVDMSDNANKMGTNMGLIQNAYQGFAKQNYTMLDNLKLGYGGTAAEMARLVNDSGVLGDAVTVTAETINEVSFDKIIEAIHSVQDNMGITGTTSREAASTIQGSIGMMKSAWENFLTGAADPKQDFDELMNNLVDSVLAVADNLIPRFVETVPRIVDGLLQLVDKLAAYLPEILAKLIPSLISGAAKVIETLISEIPALFMGMKPVVIEALQNVVDSVCEHLGIASVNINDIFVKIGDFFSNFWSDLWGKCQAIWDSTGRPIWDLLSSTVNDLRDKFESAMPQIKDYVKQCFEDVKTLWETWLKPVFDGICNTIENVIVPSVSYAFDFVESIWESVGKPVFDRIVEIVGKVREVFNQYMPEIADFVGQCFEDIQVFWENNLQPTFEAIKAFIENVVAPVVMWLADVFKEVFNNFIGPAVDTTFQFIKDLWNNTLKPVFTGITDFLTGIFTLNFKQAFEGLVNLVDGIWQGIISIIKYPINQVINLINAFIKGLNNIQIPDWVPGVGGKGLNIPLIPQLAKGGVLEKGQLGILEGSGAEAVVPLDQNKKWIAKVAEDMEATINSGSDKQLKELVAVFRDFIDEFPRMMTDSYKEMRFNINNREFARLTKAVNGNA